MSKGYSLHIGLNAVDPDHYEGWDGALNACVSDATSMEEIARSRGFDATKLLDDDATREAVKDRLDELAATLVAGDKLVISYSGHGGSVRDRNGDEDDGLDETWCLWDGQLLDDELNVHYTKFAPGVRIVVCSDSCHSGTVTRNPMGIAIPQGARIMPLDVVRRVYGKHAAMYDALAGRHAEAGTRPRQSERHPVVGLSGQGVLSRRTVQRCVHHAALAGVGQREVRRNVRVVPRRDPGEDARESAAQPVRDRRR